MKSGSIEILDRDTKKDEAGRRLLTDDAWEEILLAYQSVETNSVLPFRSGR